MYVPTIIPNKMSSLKPTKRKIVRTVYTTEKAAKTVKTELPENLKCFAQAVQDACKNIRTKLTHS